MRAVSLPGRRVQVFRLFHYLKQLCSIYVLCNEVPGCGDLLFKVIYLVRHHEPEVSALELYILHIRYPAEQADFRAPLCRYLLKRALYLRADLSEVPSGYPVQYYAADEACFIVCEDALYDRDHGRAHALDIYDENCRSPGRSRDIVAGSSARGARDAVVYPHHSFDHSTVAVRLSDLSADVFVTAEERVEVASRHTYDAPVKHRIYVVRPALVCADIVSSVLQE